MGIDLGIQQSLSEENPLLYPLIKVKEGAGIQCLSG